MMSTMTPGTGCPPINAHAGVNVRVDVYDADSGDLISSQETHNLVVKAGLNLLKSAISTGSCVYPGWFAFGTSNTAASASDTALVHEVFRDVITTSTPDAVNPTITMQYYLPSGSANGNTLQEVGLMTAASAGTMYARVVLATPIVKTASVAVSFTWTLTWAAV